ncbi:MAG: glycosyltransferase family 4 protein [Bacteroidia bacterium]|nr:glycosyltransferase family 4 protein [Bacteroidia bacterium]
MNNRILYLHGRPSSHFLHNSLATSLGVDHKPIDEKYRWQDQEFGPLRNLYAWFRNAFAYKGYQHYDYILVDGLHFSPIIAKKLGILPKRITIIAHMGNQLPYFFLAKKIPFYSRLMHKWLINNYDHIFCEGEFMRGMIRRMRPDIKPSLHVTFLGPLENRLKVLHTIQPQFATNTMISIATGPGEARIYYKGLDIMCEAFLMARKDMPELKYYIVGNWSEADISRLTKGYSVEDRKNIFFVGHSDNIEDYMKNADLSIHTARGDAFPTSTVEAMHAGVPIIVSDQTGTKQIIEEAHLDLIVEPSAEQLAAKIRWYFNLPLEEKKELSEKLRVSASNYTEAKAIKHYQNTFKQIKS